MKKNELINLINRKKILHESLDIIKDYSDKNITEDFEISTDTKRSIFYGEDFAEMAKIFHMIDDLSPKIDELLSRPINKDETEKADNIKRSFHRFMNLYSNYLRYLRNSMDELKKNENFEY